MSVALAFTATNGDAYETHMGRWSRLLAEVFIDFVGVDDSEQILDLGCGTGSLSYALARRVDYREIHGVDLSEAYIGHASERTTDPRMKFSVGSATDIPLGDNSVDRVMPLLLMTFVPDTQLALAEMRRVARPGAVIAAAVWDVRGGHVNNRIFWDTASVLDPRADAARTVNYTRPMTRPGELAAAWHAAGLENIEEGMLGIRMKFESFDDFWAPNLGKQGPVADYLELLEPDEFDRVRHYVKQAYVGGEEDGARSFAAVAWAVKGTVPLA